MLKTAASTSSALPATKKDKERPLLDDIRLLGRILGDVIREQDGAPAYELVEQIRKLSVAFRRDSDEAAHEGLKKLLKSLSNEQTRQRHPRLHLL
jgi:phosphoenolpyruvate carboxylase